MPKENESIKIGGVMSRPIFSSRVSNAIANGVFLLSLLIIFFYNAWWPWILLAFCAWLAIGQYFRGRLFDMGVTCTILIGLFIINFFNITWSALMTGLLFFGGIYIILREYFIRDEDAAKNCSEKEKE